MDDPKFTEAQINKQLAAQHPFFPISVHWDGETIDLDTDGAYFHVIVDEGDCPLFITDDGDCLSITEILEPRHYAQIGWSNTPSKLASILIQAIKDLIEEGKIEVYTEDKA